jgi:hypothetical protein
VAEVRADPSRKSRGNAAMYGMMAKVPFRGLVRKGVEGVMEAMYGPGNGEIDLSKSNDGPLVAKLKELAPRALDAIDALRSRFTRR